MNRVITDKESLQPLLDPASKTPSASAASQSSLIYIEITFVHDQSLILGLHSAEASLLISDNIIDETPLHKPTSPM
jgi:hypothetical protein